MIKLPKIQVLVSQGRQSEIWLKKIGNDEALQDAGAKKASKPLKEVYVEADEDHIKMKDGKSRFLKLIYVYEGYEKVRKGRRRLINPYYFSGLYASQANAELWKNVQNYIFNRYGSDVKVIFTRDGGNWLKAGKDFLQNCTHLLEYFHIAQACARITKGLDWEVGKKALGALVSGDLESFEAIVNERLDRKITSGRKSRVRGQRNYLLGYLEEIKLYGQGVSLY